MMNLSLLAPFQMHFKGNICRKAYKFILHLRYRNKQRWKSMALVDFLCNHHDPDFLSLPHAKILKTRYILCLLPFNHPLSLTIGKDRQRPMRSLLLHFLLFSCALSTASMGQTQPQPLPPAHPTTLRHGQFSAAGKQIPYTLSIESTDLPNSAGQPAARLVSFDYLAEAQQDPATRPVLFVFNGGPITASLWLHLGVIGPRRAAIPADLAAPTSSYKLVDNAYSPLDAADLVFIDPASTGFSRVLPGTKPESYYSV